MNYWGEKAFWLNEIISHMNNEGAYYSSGWLYIWPDGTDTRDVSDYFGTEEEYKELENTFKKVYKAYHRDGLYSSHGIGPELLAKAHEWDKELGLAEITDVSKQKMPKAQDKMEEEIVAILKEAGIEDFEIEEEHDSDYPEEPYKCLYFEEDEDAKKAYKALNNSGKWPSVKAIKDFWGKDGYSEIEVLVSNFADKKVDEEYLVEVTTKEYKKGAKNQLSTETEEAIKNGDWNKAWDLAKQDLNLSDEEKSNKDSFVLYIRELSLGLINKEPKDGYVAVKGLKGTSEVTKDRFLSSIRGKEAGIKFSKNPKNGEGYLIDEKGFKEILTNYFENDIPLDDIVVLNFADARSLAQILSNSIKAGSIDIRNLDDIITENHLETGNVSRQALVLDAYIKSRTGKDKKDYSKLTIDYLNPISYDLYDCIDAYKLEDNPFIEFLAAFAFRYEDFKWKANYFRGLRNIIAYFGKKYIEDVFKPEASSYLLSHKDLYENKNSKDIVEYFKDFNAIWRSGLATAINYGTTANLARAIILPATSNLNELISERSTEKALSTVSWEDVYTSSLLSLSEFQDRIETLKGIKRTGESKPESEEASEEEPKPETKEEPRDSKEYISTVDKAFKSTVEDSGIDLNGLSDEEIEALRKLFSFSVKNGHINDRDSFSKVMELLNRVASTDDETFQKIINTLKINK